MPAFDPDHWIKYCCVIDQWRRPTESILNSSRICHHFHSLEALWSSTTLCCYQMLQSIQLCALLYFLSDIRRSYRRHPWILRELSRRVVNLGHRRFRTDILGELVELVKILCTVVYRLSDRRKLTSSRGVDSSATSHEGTLHEYESIPALILVITYGWAYR